MLVKKTSQWRRSGPNLKPKTPKSWSSFIRSEGQSLHRMRPNNLTPLWYLRQGQHNRYVLLRLCYFEKLKVVWTTAIDDPLTTPSRRKSSFCSHNRQPWTQRWRKLTFWFGVNTWAVKPTPLTNRHFSDVCQCSDRFNQNFEKLRVNLTVFFLVFVCVFVQKSLHRKKNWFA